MVAAINLALPKLSGSSLEPTSTQLLWIVDAYILVFGGLLVVAGSLADRFTARELGSTVHTQTLTAFTDAMALGFRVVAAIVLVSAIVVAAGMRNRPTALTLIG
jgi:uncharacterized SAM-binding protein YcdF (DUF218 family)